MSRHGADWLQAVETGWVSKAAVVQAADAGEGHWFS